MANIYIENYGCTANYDDGAIIAGLLIEANHNITKDIDEADLIVINSCAVKNVTVNRISTKLQSLNDRKVVVTGCMPVAENERLKRIIPQASLVSSQNVINIVDAVNKTLEGETVILTSKSKEIKTGLPKYLSNTRVVSLQIGSGCKSYCTFCSTKLAKGDLISYPIQSIKKELEHYVKIGFKRLNITSTDNGCYGFDINCNLADLVNELIKVKGDFLLRIGMANPQHLKFITDELVETYKNKKIMKFLHIPVQSGSNKILKNMKRKYNIDEFKEIVKKFRDNIPGISISTDIIVGYPGETEEDFQNTIDLVKDLKFEVMNISKFASRPGTFANKLKQLPTELIKERSTRLTEVFLSLRN